MADANIGSLPAAAVLDDDSLLVAEQQGTAVSVSGALFKRFARVGVAEYVEAAQDAARNALEAAQQAQDAVTSVQGAAAEAAAAEAANAAAQAAMQAAQAAQSAAETAAQSAADDAAQDVANDMSAYVAAAQAAQAAAEAARDQAQAIAGGNFLPLAGGTMTGAITLPGDPTEDLHAAPKQYVDAHASDTTAHITADERAAWNAKASKPKAVPVTLTAAGWTDGAQTVAVSGVLADETAQLIQPIPSAASQAAYIEAGILCTGQAADSLTFSCETVPTEDITLYVMLQEVTA